MSDTPRTDGEAWRELEECNEVVCADFSRELEREVNRLLRILNYVRDSSDGAENAYQFIRQVIDDET